MFSKWCRAVKHADRPPVLQCQNCWKFGHHAARYRVEARCRICTEHHNESKHAEDDTVMDESNRNPAAKCVNCGDNHPATDRQCPERIRLTEVAREMEAKRGAAGGGRVRKKGSRDDGGEGSGERQSTGGEDREDEGGFTVVGRRGRGKKRSNGGSRATGDGASEEHTATRQESGEETTAKHTPNEN
ncbi:hypothetical protein H0H92_006709 [Tricholoma furcatifolium]|nr:hypothetical protein H0H92_006709 [Tricholoma furcatifolium]